MEDEAMQPWYTYLQERRRVLLDELEQIERLLGTSPRTSEIRRQWREERRATIPNSLLTSPEKSL